MPNLSFQNWVTLTLGLTSILLYLLNASKAARLHALKVDLEQAKGKLQRQEADALLRELNARVGEAEEEYETEKNTYYLSTGRKPPGNA